IGRELILEVLDEKEDLLNIGLGILTEELQKVKKLGFYPIVRLKNSNRLSADLVKQKLLSFSEISPESLLLFDGDMVLGYPSQLELIRSKMKSKQISLGRVEFFDQRGMSYLLDDLYYNLSKVHSISPEEMLAISPEKALNRYLRAAKERGVDVLFVHPFLRQYDASNIVDYNFKFLGLLFQKLVDRGIYVDHFSQFPDQEYQAASFFELSIISIGIFSTIIFFLTYIYHFSLGQLLLSYVGFYFVFYGFYVFDLSLFWVRLMAFITASVFPFFAIVSQFPQRVINDDWYKRLLSLFVYLFKVVSICVLGAFFVVALLSDMKFLMHVETFAGVKLSFIVSIILTGLFFYLSPHRITSLVFVFRRLYSAPIRTAGFISIVVVAGFCLILVLRSGNQFMLPFYGIEVKIRELLENLFFVRPRTKEFLIGYPFLILTYLFVDKYISRNWIWFFNIIGSVALISIINSFCHVHTPLYISFYRVCLGVVLGTFFAGVYLTVYLVLKKTVKKIF
ncbi:hypothetical protein DID76_03330, partial [Candidatus Marinamargulisbacteria bacterium SCGC AG-414-C22]